MNQLGELVLFLNRLEAAKISYRLEHNRDEAIMVIIAIPGNGGRLNSLRMEQLR